MLEKYVDKESLERYSRQILLREIGGSGQKKIINKKILVIGIGGLGCPSLNYLTSSGVGTIGFIDGDTVNLSNLNRQILFSEKNIGMLKAKVAKEKLNMINSNVNLISFPFMLNEENADKIISQFDLILDGTDNLEIRYLINKSCLKFKIPLISGSLARWEGQIMFLNYKNCSPCFECIYPRSINKKEIMNCQEGGVFAPLSGVIGTMMASEALKFITNSGENFINKIYIFDILNYQNRKIKIKKNTHCNTCK